MRNKRRAKSIFCEYREMDGPQKAVWGPALWMLLHSSAERFGSHSLRRLPEEEIRIWKGLLASFRYSLPCPRCKSHYTEYLARHPMTWNKERLRAWLHALHSQVNQHRPGMADLSLDQVENQYSVPFHFSKLVAVIQEHMQRGIAHGVVTREDMQRSLRLFEEMKRYYDFF